MNITKIMTSDQLHNCNLQLHGARLHLGSWELTTEYGTDTLTVTADKNHNMTLTD